MGFSQKYSVYKSLAGVCKFITRTVWKLKVKCGCNDITTERNCFDGDNEELWLITLCNRL